MIRIALLIIALVSLSGCPNPLNYVPRSSTERYTVEQSSLPLHARWEFKTEETILSPVIFHEPFGAYLRTTTTIYLVDPDSGLTQWQYELSTVADAAPVVWGQYAYFPTDQGNSLIALAGDTGKLQWIFEPSSVTTAEAGKPLIRFLTPDEQSLYVTVNLRRGTDVIQLDPRTGEALGLLPPEFPRHSVTAYDFYVGPTWLVLNGIEQFWVFSRDLSQIIDRVELSLGSYREPTYAGEMLYTSGQMVKAISLPDFKEKWRFEDTCLLPWDQVPESPVVFDRDVYINSTCGLVYRLDATTGEVLWQYQSDLEILEMTALNGIGYFVTSYAGMDAVDLSNGNRIGTLSVRPKFVQQLSPYQYLASNQDMLILTFGNNQAFGLK